MGALVPVKTGIRIEESWPQFRPYRWLAERLRRKLIHRESFRASVLHLSDTKRWKITAREFCVLTTPSLLSKATPRKKQIQNHFCVLRCGHVPARGETEK